MQILPSSVSISFKKELPLWLSWLRILPQFRRPGFNLWVGKIPWRGERLPTPVFWSGEFHGLYSSWGCRVGHDSATFLHFKKEAHYKHTMCACVGALLLICLWPYGLYVACRASLSVRFPQQEYWSGLSFPSPGNLPRPRDQTCISCISRWIICH